ncbi:regulatory protein, LuxR [Rhizorhabdus wittichii RW1]|uniref:Regulatory protein, LuxR n=2 Tax=Rhizorhabdus wittichii TaxID=160791 RepID=A0A9J9HES9_RHIWR|nr:regulatory protein, LuxR [Rhizorhabdus wittichii RW1]
MADAPRTWTRTVGRRLAPPALQPGLCERTLLLRSLDVACAGRLTLVIGPAGFGKTTALAQWHASLVRRGQTACWCTMSEEERDPSRFLWMLALALEAAGIALDGDVLRTVSDGSVGLACDALLMALERAAPKGAIVIEEFERIDHPPIAALVAELVDGLPEDMHLVLSARRKPKLPISVLRVQGRVRVIDPAELRFGRRELTALLDDGADAEALETIEQQTEGWPVAVQLYRLWRERAGADAVVPKSSGLASEVADYLAEQIFDGLAVDAQDMLIDLSIAEYCEIPLADFIRQSQDSAALLRQVADQLPGLVQRSDAEDDLVYRLHPLLLGHARARLALKPGRADLIHGRASDWYWRNARFAAAIHHAVLSHDEALLARRIEELPFLDILGTAGAGELLHILNQVPAACQGLPQVRLITILLLFRNGLFPEAEQMRAEEERLLADRADAADPQVRRLRLGNLALKLLFAVHIDGFVADHDRLVAEIRALSLDAPATWAWVECLSATILQIRGDLDAAAEALLRAGKLSAAIGKPTPAASMATCQTLILGLAHGRLGHVLETVTAIRQPAAGQGTEQAVGEQALHAMAGIAAAVVDYERGYRVQAAEALRMALAEFGESEAWFDQYALALPIIVDVTYRRHGFDAARQEIERLRERAKRLGLRGVLGLLSTIELFQAVRAGEPAVADAAEPADDATLSWRERDTMRLALGRLAMERGAFDRAAGLAARAIAAGEAGDRLGTRIRGSILLGLARDRGGDADGADDALREAVRLSYPEGYVAPFAQEGRSIVPLLQRAIGKGSVIEQRLLAQVARAIEREREFAAPDALSNREAEIVAHLADGASNKVIARRLGLSDNTIKFHLKKVYAKLGVSSRKAAAAAAAKFVADGR